MDITSLLIQQIASLFVIMLFGFLLAKCNIISLKGNKTLSTLVLYVCSPCAIISSFHMEFSTDKLWGLCIAVAGAVAANVIYIAIAKLCGRLAGFNGIEQTSMVYTNCGNLIIPLVGAVLGTEWVFYTCAYIAVHNVLVWTHGKSLVCEEPSFDWKKIVVNINILAIVLGLILFLTPAELPPIVQTAIESTGNCIGPVSMIVIGVLIAYSDLKSILRNKRVYFISLMRLLLFPLITVFLFAIPALSGLHPDVHQILLVVLLSAAAPVAVTITQFAQLYDKDAVYASAINVLSVLLCIVTMPLIAHIYQLLV